MKDYFQIFILDVDTDTYFYVDERIYSTVSSAKYALEDKIQELISRGYKIFRENHFPKDTYQIEGTNMFISYRLLRLW